MSLESTPYPVHQPHPSLTRTFLSPSITPHSFTPDLKPTGFTNLSHDTLSYGLGTDFMDFVTKPFLLKKFLSLLFVFFCSTWYIKLANSQLFGTYKTYSIGSYWASVAAVSKYSSVLTGMSSKHNCASTMQFKCCCVYSVSHKKEDTSFSPLTSLVIETSLKNSRQRPISRSRPRHWYWVLTSRPRLHTVGWLTWRRTWPAKTCTTFPWGSPLEKVQDKKTGRNWLIQIHLENWH